MKKLINLFSVLTICVMVACNDNDLDSINVQNGKSVDNQNINVENVDGVLCFATVEDFDKAIDMLTAQNADLKGFEDKYNFESLASYQNDIFEMLDSIDNPETYTKILEKYKKYVVYDVEQDYVKPAIDALGYASIANVEGKYMIDNVMYEVTPDYLLIHSSATRSSTPQKLEYKFDGLLPNTRGENTESYVDTYYSNGDDRRLYTDVKSIMYWTLESSSGGQNTYSAKYSFVFHIRAQKKNFFGNWKNYNTICHFEHLSFVFEIPGQSPEWWGQLTANDWEGGQGTTWTSGEVANYTLTFNSNRYYTTYDFYRPYALLIQYRATTRGTGSCGAAINIGNNAYNLPDLNTCS